MKKKVISVLLALTMVASLTACGGNAGGDSAGTDATPADDGAAAEEAAPAEDAAGEEAAVTEGASADDNTLTVWTWDPNFNVYAINKAAEIYAQDHEGFKVEVSEVQSDDIETRITTAVSAGDLSTLPDIFLMQDNSFQKYVINYPDVFTDLTSSGINFGDFSAAKVAYSTIDGKNYGIPFDNGTVINCVRTDILEQAGFTVDDFTDITWSDYMEKAKVVLEKTGVPFGCERNDLLHASGPAGFLDGLFLHVSGIENRKLFEIESHLESQIIRSADRQERTGNHWTTQKPIRIADGFYAF